MRPQNLPCKGEPCMQPGISEMKEMIQFCSTLSLVIHVPCTAVSKLWLKCLSRRGVSTPAGRAWPPRWGAFLCEEAHHPLSQYLTSVAQEPTRRLFHTLPPPTFEMLSSQLHPFLQPFLICVASGFLTVPFDHFKHCTTHSVSDGWWSGVCRG